MIDRRTFSAALIASAASALIAPAAKAQIATEVRARPSSARFADKPEDFAKLGIQPGRIEVFEDGMRTQGGPGGYEWWYFDSHLGDGSTLVIVFYTNPQLNPDGKVAPFAPMMAARSGSTLKTNIRTQKAENRSRTSLSTSMRMGRNGIG